MSKWKVALLVGALCLAGAAVVVGALLFVGYQGYQNALRSGNEAATVATLNRIAVGQASYALSNHGAFGTFPQLIKDGSLDERFGSGKPRVYGYVFTMTVGSKSATQKDSFSINADPDESTPKGRHFYTDVSGSIHVNPSQPATATDPLFTDSTAH